MMNREQSDPDQDLEFDRSPILITKLYRPPVPPNAEPRTALLAQLERNRHRAMTLISAPPGYGKSTLASMWMETTDWPSTWVSLDEEDNSFSSFLAYLLVALRQLFPEMKMATEELLHSSIPSPPAVIARYLLNDLAQADTSFMLVLDDLNLVREPKVSEMLAELLRHPARTMHLVVISRRDPPLPLAAMRARRQMTEVRAQDLRFTVTEAGGMLSKALSREVDERTAAAWVEQTEGWVTALHLAALSLRHRKEHEGLGPAEPVGSQYLQDYLLDEVLAKVPPEYLPWLLATALVDRFCASLCEALSQPEGRDETSEKSLGGEEFVRWLQEANLFVVALDAERRWFRFHHLFRQLLVDALLRRPQTVDAVAVHKRASHWFVQHGLIEEAIRHDLDAGDTASATQLVAQHRHGPINADQWHELDRWLRQFPEDVVANDPILTLSQARLPAAFGQRLYLLVERAGNLASSLPADAPNRSEVLGELAFFTALQAVLAGPGDRAVEKGAEAFSLLPPHARHVRCMAIGAQAVGYQMSGDYVRGIRFLEETLSAYTWLPRDRSQLLLYRAFLSLLEGNLPAGVLSVRDCLRVDAGSRAWYTIGQAYYVAGISHYLRNEPEAARAHLQVMVDNRAFVDPGYLAHSACALLRIYYARAEFEKAGELFQLITSHLQLSDDAWSLEVLRGFEVELALDLGDIEAAQRLALTVNFVDYRDIWFWYLLQLTPIKLLLAQSGAEDLARARTLLDELDAHVHAIHRHSARIDVLSLLALVAEAQGDTPGALDKLKEALALAEPGGFIRNFVDLGRPMADLLIGLRQGNGIAPSLLAHVDRILALFPATNSTGVPLASAHAERPTIRAVRFPSEKPLAKPLTKREQQILTRLNSEQSPDEIARDLSVSTATVRSHIKGVYAKLDVHSRYEAVDRARELGLL